MAMLRFAALAFMCLLVMPAVPLKAQTHKIDSLRFEALITTDPSQQLDALLRLCEQAPSLNGDTLYHYAVQARHMAGFLGDGPRSVLADVYLEICLERRNLFDSALHMIERNSRKVSYANAPEAYAKTCMQKCYIFMRMDRHKEAQDYTFRFLQEAETNEDTASQIFCKYIIGAVYRNMEQTEQALQWFYRAAGTGTDVRYDIRKNDIGVFLMLGMMYNWKADADTTIPAYKADSTMEMFYLDKTIAYCRQSENLAILARALCIKADGTEDAAHLVSAGQYLNEANHIYDQLGDTLSILNGLTAMSNYYMTANEPLKGIAACLRGIDIVKRGVAYPLSDLYWTLAQCYKAAGNFEKYGETLNTLITLKDKVYKTNSEHELAALNARYEDQKKENIIVRQKLDIASKKNTIYGALALSIFLLATIAVLLQYFRGRYEAQRERQKLAVAKAEEAERKRISADLHDNIGAYATAISANVDEMMMDEATITPSSLEVLKNNTKEISASLRDMIWVLNKEMVTLTSICDRVKIFVQRMQPVYSRIAIDVEEDIEADAVFSPLQALHIFRIIQEALNNALKHSHCTAVRITFITTAEPSDVIYPGGFVPYTVITIEDNGKGLGSTSFAGQGHGLQNMLVRSQEAGLIMTFEEAEPHGTKIQLKNT